MEATLSKGAPDRIRELRQAQTEAEQRLWRLLRHRRFQGFKFRRQHPITPYILDFYCHEARLGIEVDGGQHNDPETRRQDATRTVFLTSKGIAVLRFWNHEVLQHGQAVLEQLDEALTPTLSRRERGADATAPKEGATGDHTGRSPARRNQR
jgi:very-short-patch-repair endonuclease